MSKSKPNRYVVRGREARLIIDFRGQACVVKIDVADLPLVRSRRWSITRGKNGRLDVHTRANKKLLFLSRSLLLPSDDHVVRFLNGDSLDCRRRNLREVTRNELSLVAAKRNERGCTGHRNIQHRRGSSRFIVRFEWNGRKVQVGTFDRLKDAVARRDEVRKRLLAGEPIVPGPHGGAKR